MHFVFVNQFYPPDAAPTGVMLKAVVEGLLDRGHQVTVICGAVGYAADGAEGIEDGETRPGLKIQRLASWGGGRRSAFSKLAAYITFYAAAALRMSMTRADLVFALTTPPFLSVLARITTRIRRSSHAHWVMDLYPDVMVAHGMIPETGLRHRVLRWFARWGFGGKRCRGILTLGPDMAERVQALLRPPLTCKWIPLWGTAATLAEPCIVEQLRKSRGWHPGETIFVYSGNMGLGHRFSEMIEAAMQLSGLEGFRLAYFGEGRRKNEILQALTRWADGPHSMHGYVGAGDLSAHLQSADVHLASLDPAWDGTMVPSKLQGIFSAGRPVIFTGSRTSSIGRWIIEAGAGWVCEPGDIEAHKQAILEALNPEKRGAFGAAALSFSRQHFDRDTNVAGIASFLEERCR